MTSECVSTCVIIVIIISKCNILTKVDQNTSHIKYCCGFLTIIIVMHSVR